MNSLKTNRKDSIGCTTMEGFKDIQCLNEKILSDIIAVLQKNTSSIEEFDILPVVQSKNRSPILFIENSLGIESWCVKNLYFFCYEACFRLKESWKRDSDKLARFSLGALLFNPDVITIWNLRKKLVESGSVTYREDLQLTSVILKRKPKCVEALAHRRWVLGNLPDVNWVSNELSLAQRLAEKAKSNYHAWNHRQWVFKRSPSPESLVLKELAAVQKWTETHVSDHSGWQYCQFLFACLSPCQMQSSLPAELSRCSELILTYPGHEAIWSHRRFIVSSLTTTTNRNDVVRDENAFIENMEKDCRHDETQKWLMDRHVLWMKKVICQSV